MDNKQSPPSKFETKNWVEINNDARGLCNICSQIRTKTTMLKSSLCNYSDAQIVVKGTIKLSNAENYSERLRNLWQYYRD